MDLKLLPLIHQLSKGFLLILVLAKPFVSSHAALDDPICKAETYLNSMITLEANFSQLNSDGSISTGKFYLSRPGKFRLAYNHPKGLLVICNGQDIVNYDPGNADPTSVELKATPISFILDKHISLEGDVTVTSILPNAKGLSLTLVKTAEPEVGSITLFFNQSPYMLEKWIVNDGQGGRTEVNLQNVILNQKQDQRLFKLE
ncbi:MAG: outer membrane lipoprotein carrier protein LolA [Alphaproteobacteria bacterium]|nr:outer membrane lipoprotein carrier protein LolA [Alphaproteobacteria bacterium]